MWYLPAVEYYSFGKRKEILMCATTRMHLEDVMLGEISQSQKDKYCVILQYLYEAPSCTDTEVEWWLPGAGGDGGLLFNGYRISVFQDEKVLHNNMNILNTTELYT